MVFNLSAFFKALSIYNSFNIVPTKKEPECWSNSPSSICLKTSINLLDISGLTFTLATSVVNSYITINNHVTGYGYILIPSNFDQPSNLKNSTNGCLGFNVPYLLQSDMIIKDGNGFDVRYKVYRTYNRTTGEANIWMCD